MEAIHILLVEDNEGDIVLTKLALEESKLDIKLSVVKDGKEAIDFLNKEGKYSAVQMPDILLLDVNLPKRNGHEVLKIIKADTNLKHIPVIMLSTSSSQSDVNSSYSNNANCFITKPVEIDEFMSVVATIENFWVSVVRLPTNNLRYG